MKRRARAREGRALLSEQALVRWGWLGGCLRWEALTDRRASRRSPRSSSQPRSWHGTSLSSGRRSLSGSSLVSTSTTSQQAGRRRRLGTTQGRRECNLRARGCGAGSGMSCADGAAACSHSRVPASDLQVRDGVSLSPPKHALSAVHRPPHPFVTHCCLPPSAAEALLISPGASLGLRLARLEQQD